MVHFFMATTSRGKGGKRRSSEDIVPIYGGSKTGRKKSTDAEESISFLACELEVIVILAPGMVKREGGGVGSITNIPK